MNARTRNGERLYAVGAEVRPLRVRVWFTYHDVKTDQYTTTVDWNASIASVRRMRRIVLPLTHEIISVSGNEVSFQYWSHYSKKTAVNLLAFLDAYVKVAA